MTFVLALFGIFIQVKMVYMSVLSGRLGGTYNNDCKIL